jgi:hypothetical protein
MRKVELHPEVFSELEQSRAWYDEQARGLGQEFLDEVDQAMMAIEQRPQSWPNYIAGTHRFLLHRFPFGIIYRYDRESSHILAVMHLHRKPGYWKGRAF